MLSEHKSDKEKKKEDHHDARNTAPPVNQTGNPHGPTANASAEGAAAVMGHYADGAHNQADSKPGKAAEGLQQEMVNDPRFSEDHKVVQNGTGRIIGVSIVGGQTRIMIALGQKQGVAPGMMGYVKKGNGMLADFQIDSVGDRVAHAMVEATPDMLHDNNMVVVNPTQMPKSSESEGDMKARIVNLDIVGGKTRITIGRGTSHGARHGMAGYIVGSGGKPFEKFVIEEAHSTFSYAFVEHTIDGLKGHDQIILNPGGH